jgi:acetyltransferase-like isoleucine patch superfamily enzyme
VSALAGFVERVVKRIKGDPSYRFTSEYRDGQLWAVLWYRGLQLVRGLPLRVRTPGLAGPMFRGRRVVVEHAGQFSAGPGLIMEDDVFVSALSREGGGIRLGRNVTLGRGASLIATGVIAHLGEGIRMGDRCAVGAGSFLAGQGGIEIGDDTIMGPGVRIVSENHRFSDVTVPIRAQGVRRIGIVVGTDCWIGAGAIILDGVSLGQGCVVAAGSVVTGIVPPLSVVAGVPARVIRSRRSAAGSGPAPLVAPAGAPGLVPREADAHTLRPDR